ncbi:MAG: gas vesicle protein GvpG [Planctomycetia bacterium]|nr:gas vesicle protein GvpG [Planctomycetia bacterium]
MFLIDDILLAPARGLAAICRKVQEAAQQERAEQETSIVAQLTELHRLLEAGGISDTEFNDRETALLERLESLRGATGEAE